MRRLLYTSDPYEPSGTIGIYETEEQKQKIIDAYVAFSMAMIPLDDDYYRSKVFDEEIVVGEFYP